jgi:hypothetical protein
VVDNVSGTFTSYINGTQVQQNTGLTLDGRWAMGPTMPLSPTKTRKCRGFVNSVQLRPEAMIAADILALGGPAPAVAPLPGKIDYSPDQSEWWREFCRRKFPSDILTSANPSGSVQIDLYRGGHFSKTWHRLR